MGSSAIRYISLFSGIEAATVAADPLGWEPLAFCEVDEFPSAVLAHHYPHVPNLGDITTTDWRKYRGKADLIIGGSPCQSFSIAGKREGLKGESGLMFEYIRAVQEIMPEWFVWENVPHALSIEHGYAFWQLLAEMEKCGYGMAWRILDSQFFGVPQRRRRIFLVGHLGDERAGEVLFEPDSLQGHFKKSREKRQELAAGITGGPNGGEYGSITGWDVQSKRIFDPDGVAPSLQSGTGEGKNITPSVMCPADVYGSLTPWDHQSSRIFDQRGASCAIQSEGRRGADLMPAVLAFDTTNITSPDNGAHPRYGAPCQRMARGQHAPAICIQGSMIGRADKNGPQGDGLNIETSFTLNTIDRHGVAAGYEVRRLTPRECERLQGFPDNYTRISYRGKPAEECPDAPRYKALGNSFCVPVVRWIFERIDAAERGAKVVDDA